MWKLNLPRIRMAADVRKQEQRHTSNPAVGCNHQFLSFHCDLVAGHDGFHRDSSTRVSVHAHWPPQLSSTTDIGHAQTFAPAGQITTSCAADTSSCCLDAKTRAVVPARILVVDDFAPWRYAVCSMLATNAALRLVGEVSDGLQAVEKAGELQPDLVLLDIGLPKLNGMEAAKLIYKVSPSSRVLFVSQYTEPELVRQALRLGIGYVVKAQAQHDLFSAVAAALDNQQFVSATLVPYLD
jgi:CheY-like chemotaxis protein